MTKIKQALGAVMLDVVGTVLCDDDRRRLRDVSVGGVILFSRNFQNREQVSALIQEVKCLREPPLLIAVDQEGGRVQRFLKGFTRLPPMAVLGALYDSADEDQSDVLTLVRLSARLMAEELIDCGVDFSFAPVLDLGVHDQTVIGDRAFHAETETLILLADAFIQGMRAAGMQATAKHFPGHGHVLADSHLELPIDRRDLADIQAQDLQPFTALKDQYSAVMTAHVLFPAVDETVPTFSSFWLNKILRYEIGFSGLIFSDDLTMQGACIGGNIAERAQLAISAGCDMVLVCNDHAAMDELLAAKTLPAPQVSQDRMTAMQAKPKQKLTNLDKTWVKKRLSRLCG